jgi:hypothetical protein|tara:strand:- start:64 stop:309 length:246 start_codon:yes stop_codon:yes gene_type:complete
MSGRTIRPTIRKSVAKTVNLPSSLELPVIPEEFEWADEYNNTLASWWERVKGVLQFSLESQITTLTEEQVAFLNKLMEDDS